jgi:sulfite exporter TauE/SafE
MYSYAVTRQKEERQRVCRGLGITLFTVGITSLVTRDSLFVFAGLILIMIGFRLIAHGLDRLDKNIFIDRYDKSKHD